MKTDFILSIAMIIICNVVLGFTFEFITEVPIWAKYILSAGFNIACGMIIMNYLYKEKEEKENEKSF